VSEGNNRGQNARTKNRADSKLMLPHSAREKLSAAGIYCQPRVSLAHQKSPQRHVLRAVESGGAVREFGHYVAFCEGDGKPIPWLQPLESITANGPHAVIIAPLLIGVEIFRVGHTYELLICRHEARSGQNGKPPYVFSQPVFVGRQGHLSLELWGRDKEVAGEIAPEFFTHGGERNEIPPRFLLTVRAVTKGVTCLGCEKAIFARAAALLVAEAGVPAQNETALEAAR